MKEKNKHIIISNLTVKVEYPSQKLLNFVRDLKIRKASKKEQICSDT